LGPWYGHNIKDEDDQPGQNETSSNLLGPNVRVGYNPTQNVQVFADGAGFNTLGSSTDDGWGYRGIGGAHYVFDTGGSVRPFIGPHGGYIGGKGTQDGWIIGPEVGANFDVANNALLYLRAGYDRNFRNGWLEGIPYVGVGGGLKF
jgi:hypothetical protein